MTKRRYQRHREARTLQVRCAMCGFVGIVKWSEGKGGTNPPSLWLCLDHEVHIR